VIPLPARDLGFSTPELLSIRALLPNINLLREAAIVFQVAIVRWRN
jgi:hypothetical protein